MTAQAREINKVIANGCPHRWEPIWWKPEGWLRRELDPRPQAIDPKVSVVELQLRERKFYDAGYRRAYRCGLECGLAYLTKTGAVVKAEAQA